MWRWIIGRVGLAILPTACFYQPSGSANPETSEAAEVSTTEGSPTDNATGEQADSSMGTTIAATDDGSSTESTGEPGDGSCGDGVSSPTEECDDGNKIDDDECTNICTLPLCGDSILNGHESCDDGNQIDDDSCTNLCELPNCEDRIINGGESDLDCGGPCDACGGGAICTSSEDCLSLACEQTCLPLGNSCREIHDAAPNLPDGMYNIDPDGDGVPIGVNCDMLEGGWTEVARDKMDSISGWSDGMIMECGALSEAMIGPFGNGETTTKLFTLLSVPHEQIRAQARFVIIDSWDGEFATLNVDGDEVDSQSCSTLENPTICASINNECESQNFPDGFTTLIGIRNHVADAAVILLGSTLDEAAFNEAWGGDEVVLYVY